MAAVIKRAVIKSYDAQSHRATLQMAGSLGVWLTGVRVATNIVAADVAAGRACSVLFLDPTNPNEAVVIAIQTGLPSGGGGGTTDHGELSGLADDDHPQYGALAQAEAVTALWTFNEGIRIAAGKAVQDGQGAVRYEPRDTLPHNRFTGSMRINGNVGIDSDPATSPNQKLTISPTETEQTDWRGVVVSPSVTFSGNNRAATGLFGAASVTLPASSSGHNITGLNFTATEVGASAAAAANLRAVVAALNWLASGTGVTADTVTATGLELALFNSLTALSGGAIDITAGRGIRIAGRALSSAAVTIGTVEALKIEDFTGSSYDVVRLIETPFLRLLGKGNPASGETRLLLAVGAEGLLLVSVGANDSAGSGFRQLRVPNAA